MERGHEDSGGSNSYGDGVSYIFPLLVVNPHALITMEGGLPQQPPLAFNDWWFRFLMRHMVKR
jgi:hypothetical protein